MSKLEEIKQILGANPEITWNEQSARRRYLRSREGSYYSVGLQVAPKKPLLQVNSLQRFTENLIKELIPTGPSSISRCYQFPAVKRQIVRIGTLYYSEVINDPEEQKEIERRITVSIYPCQMMAKTMGFRAQIELGGYECPEPCEFARRCIYRARKKLFFTRFF